ncbi:uncharacterized protein LOC110229078 [Arabidopsis lyrata subsp. lyrata]|uniref:uncharacterized protein LOC110229078 n=1 Tax=Arabidopsis lyrata subsp. lyrata TaxID=81972 RepID=UPI000A29B9BE|nr:uncharacterized protein LOC110229078 [Arabidopsis lyrata subsp. lyrata]|eukprot:XP_020883575.1 uncharacterized protein LOC110229078 [Arabidopsis lyrata subsp. lyrata]
MSPRWPASLLALLCRVLSDSLPFASFCLLFLFPVRFLLWLALLDLPLRLCHKLKTSFNMLDNQLWTLQFNRFLFTRVRQNF